MNQAQRSYAAERISNSEYRKVKEIEEKYTTPGKSLAFNEKMDLIYLGKVKLIPRGEVTSYTDLKDAFDFSKYETKQKVDPRAAVLIQKVSDASRSARDNIMLCGDAEAIKAITDFEAIIKNL